MIRLSSVSQHLPRLSSLAVSSSSSVSIICSSLRCCCATVEYKCNLKSQCPFECLGLDRGKAPDSREVRLAYLQAVKVVHPDCGGNAEDFRRVQTAQTECLIQIESGYCNNNKKETPNNNSTGTAPSEPRHTTSAAGQERQGKWDADAKARHRDEERLKREKREEAERAEQDHREKHKKGDDDADAANHQDRQEWFREQQRKHMSNEETSDFGDSDWHSFREEFLRQKMTPKAALKMSFSAATTVDEIDKLFQAAIESRLFDADPGLALCLCLERYPYVIMLGDFHVEKSLWAIETWQTHYSRRVYCLYYQIVLNPYVDTYWLHRNPHLESSDVYGHVVRIIEMMQEAEDGDQCATVIGSVWETLRLALMNRSGLTASGYKDPLIWNPRRRQK